MEIKKIFAEITLPDDTSVIIEAPTIEMFEEKLGALERRHGKHE